MDKELPMTAHLIEPTIWTEPLFRKLSRVAKLVWFTLRTQPSRKRIPGLQVTGPAAIAELLGDEITAEEVLVSMMELEANGWMTWDQDTLLVTSPKDPAELGQHCRNPSILLRWWVDWKEMPDTAARYEYIPLLAQGLKLHAATKNFLCVFWGTFGSHYAAWYRDQTGLMPTQEWAKRPVGWEEYCAEKGYPVLEREATSHFDRIDHLEALRTAPTQSSAPPAKTQRAPQPIAAAERFRPSLPKQLAKLATPARQAAGSKRGLGQVSASASASAYARSTTTISDVSGGKELLDLERRYQKGRISDQGSHSVSEREPTRYTGERNGPKRQTAGGADSCHVGVRADYQPPQPAASTGTTDTARLVTFDRIDRSDQSSSRRSPRADDWFAEECRQRGTDLRVRCAS